MMIHALDPATNTGSALGRADEMPQISRIRLKRPSDDAEVAAFNMACFLRDQWTFGTPDLVVIEHYMNPTAHKSADAAILALAVHFTVTTMCMTRNILWKAVYPQTWRKHLLGKAYSGDVRPKGSPPLTAKQQAEKRDATKALTLKRVKLLGYLPQDSQDTDKADAAAIWDWAAHTYGRRNTGALHLFGEMASG